MGWDRWTETARTRAGHCYKNTSDERSRRTTSPQFSCRKPGGPAWRAAAVIRHRLGLSPWDGVGGLGWGYVWVVPGWGCGHLYLYVWECTCLWAGMGVWVHVGVRAGCRGAWAGALPFPSDSDSDSRGLADDRWPVDTDGYTDPDGGRDSEGQAGRDCYTKSGGLKDPDGRTFGWQGGLGRRDGVGWQDGPWSPGWQDWLDGMKDLEGSMDADGQGDSDGRVDLDSEGKVSSDGLGRQEGPRGKDGLDLDSAGRAAGCGHPCGATVTGSGATTNGAATCGAATSRATTNRAATCGAAVSGATTNGAATCGAAVSGATTNGAATCGAAVSRARTNGAATCGAAVRGATTNGVATCGATVSGATTNGAATCGAAVSRATTNGAAICGATVSRATTRSYGHPYFLLLATVSRLCPMRWQRGILLDVDASFSSHGRLLQLATYPHRRHRSNPWVFLPTGDRRFFYPGDAGQGLSEAAASQPLHAKHHSIAQPPSLYLPPSPTSLSLVDQGVQIRPALCSHPQQRRINQGPPPPWASCCSGLPLPSAEAHQPGAPVPLGELLQWFLGTGIFLGASRPAFGDPSWELPLIHATLQFFSPSSSPRPLRERPSCAMLGHGPLNHMRP